MPSGPPHLLVPLLRFFYKHFYNRFAFTYDTVSAIVSRGEWREWTRASIPFIRGRRVLEIAFGTGNLELDLVAAGYAPVGIDLSPYMAAITQRKFAARRLVPRLVRARVQQLPFPAGSFDSAIMTFPPGFITDAAAVAEFGRVLAPSGRLIWVDAPYLYPRDLWSRFLNFAYSLTGGSTEEPNLAGVLRRIPAPEWSWQVERIERSRGYVHVIVGTRREKS